MNQERLKLWTDALRSGEYEQTTRYLNKDGKFCCLGVLCEVAIADGADIKREAMSDGVVRYDGKGGFPPLPAIQWLEHDPVMDILVSHVSADGRVAEHEGVAHLNDSLGWNFADIADALEATYGVKEEVPA